MTYISPFPDSINTACPICHRAMIPTANPDLFMCPLGEQRVFVEGSEGPAPYWHAFFYRGPGRHFIIEIPPYQIRVYETNEPSSVIGKLYHYTDQWAYENIVQLDFALQLPWNQPDRAREKIKLYLALS